MPIQRRLPLRFPGALEINETVSRLDAGDSIGYFGAGVPLFVHTKEDELGKRLAPAQIIRLGLATPTEVCMKLGVGRTTLYRHQEVLEKEGIEGLVDKKPGPRGGYKLRDKKLMRAQEFLDAGQPQREVADEVGVNEKTIRNAIRRGRLKLSAPRRVGRPCVREGTHPSERSVENAATPLGVATRRVWDRILARAGKLFEASPKFEPSMGVANAGSLMALPALLELGLLETAVSVYGRLKNGFYGLRSTVLCLAYMALLRIRTPERMQFEAPGELGVLLGLDRAPEVKTIRRKLRELSEVHGAQRFSAALAQRWVEVSRREAGILYVDGHVRPYHGDAHRLTKTHVARRNLSMPATTDYWVNDKNAEPLFVVTGTMNERLISAMKGRILPEVRRLVGPERRVTMVFDREGWSPKWFKELDGQGFDVLSYRKGDYRMWPKSVFKVMEGQVEGRRVSYELAEKTVTMRPGFKMREVRRMRTDGKQTAIVTTRWKMPILQVAWRMFERWRQENFFRYMREHFALDALVDRGVEAVASGRTIPNPKRRKLDKELVKLRMEIRRLEGEYGERALDNKESERPTARGFKIANGELGQRIRDLRAQCEKILARRGREPKRVAVEDMDEEDRVVQLSPETKHLTDTIKMVAYRAETALTQLLGSGYARTEEEGRALIREILRTPADVLPDAKAGVLRVRLHGMPNGRSNAAVAHLCEQLNAAQVEFPGSRLKLRYEATFVP
jgi:prepilin-type processing-associated H-X9-DG protein